MVRTFGIVGCMLIISTITARVNKTYETFTEKLLTILGAFASIIMVWVFGDMYPHNIVACAFLSGFVGWSLGPTIGYIGQKFKLNKFLKDKNNKSNKYLSSGDGVGFEISDFSDIEIEFDTEVDLLLFSMPNI